MEEKSRKRRSLSRRITMLMALLMLVVTVAVSFISYRSLKSTYLRLYNEKAQEIVRTLANEVDGDTLAGYVETGEMDEYYAWLQTEFNKIKSGFNGVEYLYLFYPEEDHFVYVVEGHKESDDPDLASHLGDTFEYGETEYTYLVPDILAGRASENLILGEDVGYGQTISAWAPVFDSAGNVAGMVEADCILSELNAVVRGYAARIVGALVLCMLILLFLALCLLRWNVTQPIGQLTKMVDSYEHGAMNETKLRHNDEIQWLASSFTEMTRRIDAYTAEVARATTDQERIRAEFRVATQIQTDILPNEFPAFPDRKEFDIISFFRPSREIGGDFYDYFLIDSDHLALAVGDVSDKGVPASLYMVMVKTLIKNRAQQGYSPAEVLQNVSEQLLEGDRTGMFSTVWLAILELSTGKGIAANAGHEHPILCRTGKKFELQEYRHSPPVGAMEGARIRDHGFQLSPGDTLFVYTDGVMDAINEHGEPFGTERLLEAMNREPGASPSVLLQTLEAAVDRFTGGADQPDGITMLALKYYGPGSGPDEWR